MKKRLNKKKIVEAYRTLRNYPECLKNSSTKRDTKRVMDALLKHYNLIEFYPEEALNKFPELKNEKYFTPGAYMYLTLSARDDQEGFFKILRHLSEITKVNMKDIMYILGEHIQIMMTAQFLQVKPTIMYALSEDTFDKLENIGDSGELPLEDLCNTIEHPMLFVTDTKETWLLYETYNNRGTNKRVRMEWWKEGCAPIYYSLGVPEEGVTTVNDLLKWFKKSDKFLFPSDTTEDEVNRPLRLLPLLFLLKAENIMVPAPEEFNETKLELIKSGKTGQAKRHESYQFVDLDELMFKPTQRSGGPTGDTGSSKSPHLRRGHFRRQRYGTEEKGYHHKIIWIAPMAIHGGSTENRVFYII